MKLFFLFATVFQPDHNGVGHKNCDDSLDLPFSNFSPCYATVVRTESGCDGCL